MVFGLFKNKDKFGIYPFLKKVNELNNYIAKQQSKKVETTLEDVAHIIENVKNLHKESKSILSIIEKDTDIKDKNKLFMKNLVKEKFDDLKELHKKVLKYEEELLKYQKLGKKEEKKDETKTK